MSTPHLVIAAYWSTETPNDATERVCQAIDGHTVPGSGSVVSVIDPDGPLYRWLRTLQLEEAAAYGFERETVGAKRSPR